MDFEKSINLFDEVKTAMMDLQNRLLKNEREKEDLEERLLKSEMEKEQLRVNLEDSRRKLMDLELEVKPLVDPKIETQQDTKLHFPLAVADDEDLVNNHSISSEFNKILEIIRTALSDDEDSARISSNDVISDVQNETIEEQTKVATMDCGFEIDLESVQLFSSQTFPLLIPDIGDELQDTRNALTRPSASHTTYGNVDSIPEVADSNGLISHTQTEEEAIPEQPVACWHEEPGDVLSQLAEAETDTSNLDATTKSDVTVVEQLAYTDDDASSIEVLQASNDVLPVFNCSDMRYKNKKIEGYVVIPNGQPQEPVYGSGTSNSQNSSIPDVLCPAPERPEIPFETFQIKNEVVKTLHQSMTVLTNIPTVHYGRILGRGYQNIKKLKDTFGVNISVWYPPSPEEFVRVTITSGSAMSRHSVADQIMEELPVEVKVFWGVDFMSKQKKMYAKKNYPYVHIQNISQGTYILSGKLRECRKVFEDFKERRV
jgi:hypothetical protein